MGLEFFQLHDNGQPHEGIADRQFLEVKGIDTTDWPDFVRYAYKHVGAIETITCEFELLQWNFGKTLAA